jgi:RHS repeat-associated protein
VTPVGFTGHEGDDDLGLINMKGRMYDPQVGRFLMTDPIVSAPSFTQSWNPYSYVRNSPLNLVDPTGFQGVPSVGTASVKGEVYATWPTDFLAHEGAGAFRIAYDLRGGEDRVKQLQKDASRDDTASKEDPAPSAGDKAREIAIGGLEGSARFTRQFFYPNPVPYVKSMLNVTALETTRESLRHGSGAAEAIADGFNTGNPLYHAGVAVVEVDKKAQSGDYRGAAEDATVLVATMATTAAAVVGGGAAVAELPPARPFDIGGGRTFSHFTNAEGATGITGIVADNLGVGQQVGIAELRFAMGENSFMASEPGRIFVTELGPNATGGALNNIGVFGSKQQFVIQFSEETAFLQGARVAGEKASRSIYSIPGGVTLKGEFTLTRVW